MSELETVTLRLTADDYELLREVLELAHYYTEQAYAERAYHPHTRCDAACSRRATLERECDAVRQVCALFNLPEDEA